MPRCGPPGGGTPTTTDLPVGAFQGPYRQARSSDAHTGHRIVDTDPKRGNVVVRLTDRPHTPAQKGQNRTTRAPGAFLGGTLYSLIAAALFSLGIGTLLRSTAATVTVALTVLLLLPGTLSFISLDWVETIVSYLPLPASSALLTTGAAETKVPTSPHRRA